MSATIQATNLAAGHGARALFAGLDLIVASGDVIGLVGANGAGKSTLLRIIRGDLRADEGSVQVDGGLGVMDQFVGTGRTAPGAAETVAGLLVSVAPTRIRAAAIELEASEDALIETDDTATQMRYASALGDDRFFFTDLPVQGVNPPAKKDGPPPLRPDVPCETQERPDLRTKIQAPPPQIRINQNAPGSAERRAEATKKLMDWMERDLKATGLDKKYELSDEPLKASEIPAVKRTLEAGPR